ncbi:MAG: RpiB/LacA/LacB family sugar-phosphate isomerase [Candidatus Levybacteria bacterium]|nr:RpiB/LacA/LacB family sugar-phosphate isomerase [Candidatus Levybacteria bacterium]
MKVYIGSDHRGFKLAQSLEKWLKKQGFIVTNVGAKKLDPNDDYVDYAVAVARKIGGSDDSRGVVVCGSGVGVDIAANKVKGVRCGLGFSEKQVTAIRHDDNINVLALAADFLTVEQAQKLVTVFLQTPFSGEERHRRRIGKITKIDH